MLIVFAVTLRLPAAAAEAKRRPARGASRQVLTADSFRRHSFLYAAWVANVGGAVVVSTVLHLFPHLVTQLGIDSGMHGLMLAANRLSVILTYVAMYYSSFWKERVSFPAAALLLALAGSWMLAVGSSVTVLTCGLVLIGVLAGSNYLASVYSTSLFDESERGLASGLHEASLAFGFALGTIGGGIAGAVSERAPYYLCMVVLVFGVVGLMAIRAAASPD
jgi:MFS family permease